MGIFDRIVGQLGDLIDQIEGPDDVRLHLERGEGLLQAGDLDGAARELARVLQLRPDHARAALLLGRVELGRGDLAAAERALRESLAARPDAAEALVLLGETLLARGDIEGAGDALRRGLEAGLSDAELRGAAWRGLGALHLAAGRADKAVRELRKAAAALPADADSHRLLGEALAARGDLDGARVCLEKAAAEVGALPAPSGEREGAVAGDAEEAPPGSIAARRREALRARRAVVLVRLADVQRRLGRDAEARATYERAFAEKPGLPDAHLGLALIDAAAGDAATALHHAGEALALERSARTLLSRARLLGAPPLEVQAAFEEARAAATTRAERAAIALEAMRRALHDLDDAPAALRPALAGAVAQAADRVEEDAPGGGGDRGALDPTAEATRSPIAGEEAATAVADVLAARAMVAVAGSGSAAPDLDEAAALADRALAAADSLEPRLAHAAVAIARGGSPDRAAAAASLRRAVELSPAGDQRARRWLAALHRPLPLPVTGTEPADLYVLLRAAHARLQSAPELSDLAPEAARILEIVDRPLLVTVMGEFNAGKSTFVNALLGEEVAPMGILPTTATINVLKYGAERGGRVVYRDDSVRLVPWSQVGPLLRALDEEEARRIRFVEVLYPLETLQRVNIVDTPGLNSIRQEHEATAREFITQADAVIWLFSCRQPGTASEREALEKVREAHKKALGVVNQIDRLAGDAEVDEIVSHLDEHFRDLVETLVPFSALDALLGRTDAARTGRSRKALLERTLEERFFNRAKAIQRTQAVRRAATLLDEARARATSATTSERPEALSSARAAQHAGRVAFSGFLDEERLALIADLDGLYSQAAREVLDFVRPRSWPFGSNEAAPADRDFLVDLVEERLGALIGGSRSRVVGEVERAAAAGLTAVLPRDAAALLAEEVRLLDEQVYGRYRAFLRGFLRGGRVDEFFTRVLPRLELGEQSIRRALLRDLPALDVLQEELLAPLRGFGERFFARMARALDREAAEEELRRLEIEERLTAPLEQLRAALAHFSVDETDVFGDAAGGAHPGA